MSSSPCECARSFAKTNKQKLQINARPDPVPVTVIEMFAETGAANALVYFPRTKPISIPNFSSPSPIAGCSFDASYTSKVVERYNDSWR